MQERDRRLAGPVRSGHPVVVVGIPRNVIRDRRWTERPISPRQLASIQPARSATDDAIRSLGGKSAAEQIAEAEALLNSGTIDRADKRRVLALSEELDDLYRDEIVRWTALA